MDHLKKITKKQGKELMAKAQEYGVMMSEIKRKWKLYNIIDLRRGTLPKVMEWVEAHGSWTGDRDRNLNERGM